MLFTFNPESLSKQGLVGKTLWNLRQKNRHWRSFESFSLPLNPPLGHSISTDFLTFVRPKRRRCQLRRAWRAGMMMHLGPLTNAAEVLVIDEVIVIINHAWVSIILYMQALIRSTNHITSDCTFPAIWCGWPCDRTWQWISPKAGFPEGRAHVNSKKP